MCKRQNEMSQIKREDYDRQTWVDVTQHHEINDSSSNFERASMDQLEGRQIIRAKRVRVKSHNDFTNHH